MRAPLRTLAGIAEASHEVQLERALLGIAEAFASSCALERLEWQEGEEHHALRRGRGANPAWRVRRLTRASRGHRNPDVRVDVELATTPAVLSLWIEAPVPTWPDEPAFRGALARLLARAAHTRTVVRKVAELSRRAHVAKRELEQQLPGSGHSGSGLVARSPKMRELETRARAVARYPTSVLISGESGAGKQVVANFVHAHSPRARAPMVEINCGALPEGLAESELFGHERGAFTGASKQHRGVFERADRGTLFLDEVAELSPLMQVKLLRVLQERRLTRVGGERSVEVDVRVIAATNRSLEDRVAAGHFREDLYFRLSVYPLEVPSLRERSEDLPVLVDALLTQLCARLGRAKPLLDDASLARLQRANWPGNVRQLANILEASLITSPEQRLHLPARLGERPRPHGGGRSGGSDEDGGGVPSFEQGTRELIARALERCEGKIYGPGGAAELLELHPGTLQSKMRKLGISRQPYLERSR